MSDIVCISVSLSNSSLSVKMFKKGKNTFELKVIMNYDMGKIL